MTGCAPGAAGSSGGGLAFGPVQLLQQLMSQNCMTTTATTATAGLSALDADMIGSDDGDDHRYTYDDRSRFTRDADDSYYSEEEEEDGSEYTSATEYDGESYVSGITGFSSAAPSPRRKSGGGGGGGGGWGGRSPRRGRSLGPSPRSRDLYTNSSVAREAAEKKRGSGRNSNRSRRRGKDDGGGGGAGARSKSGGKRGNDKDVAEEGSVRQKKYDESAADLSSASNSIVETEVEDDLSVIGRSLGGGFVRDRTATSANKNKVDIGDTIVEKEVDVKDTTADTNAEDAAAAFVTEGSILKAFVEVSYHASPLFKITLQLELPNTLLTSSFFYM